MGPEPVDAHKANAMELANRAIEFQAAGNPEAAGHAWQGALGYAEQHLQADDIVLWIRSGLGNALLKTGDYIGALKMSGSAVAFCASVRAPLALMTMAEACLRLGDSSRARDYARQACALRGDDVFTTFSLADRQALGLALAP